MIEKLRNRILGFVNSEKDYPLLAGGVIGLYMMLFYYSRNFALANSAEQLIFFTAYYVLMPMLVLFAGYRLFIKLKPSVARGFLFAGLTGFPAFFLAQLLSEEYILYSAIALIAAIILSFWLRNYYKVFIILLAVMSVFNVKPLAGAAYKFAIASDEWKKLPDDIEAARFKKTPNIYYIQPDGYAGFSSLRDNPHYNIDNSDYEDFLRENGFMLYEDYRSNYQSTLLSNSAIGGRACSPRDMRRRPRTRQTATMASTAANTHFPGTATGPLWAPWMPMTTCSSCQRPTSAMVPRSAPHRGNSVFRQAPSTPRAPRPSSSSRCRTSTWPNSPTASA